MKKYFLLTKILLKSGISSIEQGKKKRKRLINIKSKLLYLLIGICFLPLLVALFFAGKEGYELLSQIGQEGVVIGIICAIASIMTFVFGISIVISVFYFSSDIEYLLPLPIKPYQIVASKFTVTLFYEYITTFVIAAPPLIGYGYASSAGIIYWIIVLFTILLLPIVPLVYGGVISIVLMRFLKRAKNRDILTIVISIFIMVLALGFNTMTNTFSSMSSEAVMDLLIKGNNSLLEVINRVFPNFILIEKALIDGDIIMLLLFMVTVLLFVIVFLFIAKLLYFKGASGISSTSSKRKALTKEQSFKIIRKRKVLYTYTVKELKLLFRTPMYFMNCVMMSIIWPVFLLIPVAAGVFGGSFGISSLKEILLGSLESGQSIVSGIIFLVVFGITVLITSFNFTAGTGISREGKSFFVMKYIPISFEKQIFAKILSGILISLIGTTLYIIIAMFVLNFPLWITLLSGILSFFTCVIFTYIQIITDLIRPKLKWETEQAAIKQNFNTMIELFFSVILGGGVCLLSVFLYGKLNISVVLIVVFAIVFLIIITFVAHKMITKFGAKRLYSLE